ncbi:hypothetical protein KI387_027691, partial [Taxus chinensis]
LPVLWYVGMTKVDACTWHVNCSTIYLKENVVSWTAMNAGYARIGFVGRVMKTFKKMQLAGVKPDSTTFVSILPASVKIGNLEQ